MLARFMRPLSNTQDSYDEYKLIAFARRPSHIYSQCFRNSLPPIPQYKPPRTRKPTRESERDEHGVKLGRSDAEVSRLRDQVADLEENAHAKAAAVESLKKDVQTINEAYVKARGL